MCMTISWQSQYTKGLWIKYWKQSQGAGATLPEIARSQCLLGAHFLIQKSKTPGIAYWKSPGVVGLQQLHSRVDWLIIAFIALLLLETVIQHLSVNVYAAQIHVDLSSRVFVFLLEWNRRPQDWLSCALTNWDSFTFTRVCILQCVALCSCVSQSIAICSSILCYAVFNVL